MIRAFFFITLLYLMPIFSTEPKVLVPIEPYAFFIEQLTENKVAAHVISPASRDMHSFEPTAKEVLSCTMASVWFVLGESFESHIEKALKQNNPSMQIVSLAEGIDPIYDHGEVDPHIWLSPKEMQKQLKTIERALIAQFPELQATIEKTSPIVSEKLQTLDAAIQKELLDLPTRTLFVGHAALGYFCRNYGLEQVAIEEHGKEPGPKQLTKLFEKIEKNSVKALFVEMQTHSKASSAIAAKYNLKLISIDPFKKDYFRSMLELSNAIKDGLA